MSKYVETLQSYLPTSEPLRSITTTVVLGAATAATVKIVLGVKNLISSARRESAAKARRAEQKKDTVYLFGFPKGSDGTQLSVPVDRVETFLKMKNIPFHFIPTTDTDISDTGRFPCVELNGAQYTDSYFIMQHLETIFNKQEELDRDQQTKLTTLNALSEYIRWHAARALTIDNVEYMIDLYAKLFDAPKFIVGRFMYPMKKKLIKIHNDAGHGDLTDNQYNLQFLEDLKALDHYCEQANESGKFILGTKNPSKGDILIVPYLRFCRRPEELVGKVPAFAFACSSENFKKYIERFDAYVDAQQ